MAELTEKKVAETVEKLRELEAFLDGSGTLETSYFGEMHAFGAFGRYWWRKTMHERFAAVYALLADPASQVERMREALTILSDESMFKDKTAMAEFARVALSASLATSLTEIAAAKRISDAWRDRARKAEAELQRLRTPPQTRQSGGTELTEAEREACEAGAHVLDERVRKLREVGAMSDGKMREQQAATLRALASEDGAAAEPTTHNQESVK